MLPSLTQSAGPHSLLGNPSDNAPAQSYPTSPSGFPASVSGAPGPLRTGFESMGGGSVSGSKAGSPTGSVNSALSGFLRQSADGGAGGARTQLFGGNMNSPLNSNTWQALPSDLQRKSSAAGGNAGGWPSTGGGPTDGLGRASPALSQQNNNPSRATSYSLPAGLTGNESAGINIQRPPSQTSAHSASGSYNTLQQQMQVGRRAFFDL